jgi:hypothetical protein
LHTFRHESELLTGPRAAGEYAYVDSGRGGVRRAGWNGGRDPRAAPVRFADCKSAPKARTPPHTPWGDPDFRGVFSNGDAYTTPLERPDRFAGRRLEDIQGQELAEVRRAQLESVIDALPGGRVRGPDAWWVQNLNVANSRQAWLVIDPPDGKIPALTADGQRRAARRVRSSFVGGPFDGPEDFSLRLMACGACPAR